MTNNKQSSIELFAIALYEGGFLQGNGDEINDLLEHHKALHKKEIIEAIMFGDCRGEMRTFVTSERYYNETYGGNK